MEIISFGVRWKVEFCVYYFLSLWLLGRCFVCLLAMKVFIAQSCLTLCDPMDCSQPAPLSMEIAKARILEWVAIPFYKGSSYPSNWTRVSCIAGRFFTVWETREALLAMMWLCNVLERGLFWWLEIFHGKHRACCLACSICFIHGSWLHKSCPRWSLSLILSWAYDTNVCNLRVLQKAL